MEGQRANAAQLAARNIKAAKGRGQRRTPIKSDGNIQQSMSFGGGEGTMFGGSVPTASTFNFSAPGNGTPSLSFPPSFGGSTTFSGNGFSAAAAVDKEEDPRADTTGEELLR